MLIVFSGCIRSTFVTLCYLQHMSQNFYIFAVASISSSDSAMA
jgi:hypothetical protein